MTYSGPDRSATVKGGLVSCWSCDRGVSPHALFCHHCGVLQPVREVDPFVRLGMPARFDIDQAELERHFAVFRRHVEPGRFAQRGARERAHARAHADALAAAFETLRNPVLRARHLLAAAGPPPGPEEAAEPAEMTARRTAVDEATEASVLDRLAATALREVEDCIRDLAAAFRAGDPGGARAQMRRLDALEALADAARSRRAGLAGGA